MTQRRFMDLALITRLGAARRANLAVADEQVNKLADELLAVEAAGGRVNVTMAADLSGIARTTIIRRMAARRTPENTTTPEDPDAR